MNRKVEDVSHKAAGGKGSDKHTESCAANE